ncbi:MAG: hypothetical protein AB1696_13705 [Planctomycetota bacterium]
MRSGVLAAAAVILAINSPLAAQVEMETGTVQVSISFRPIEKTETAWDGSASVSPGEIKKIEIVAAAFGNQVEGNTWKALTPKSYPMFGYLQLQKGKPVQIRVVDTGVILTLANTQADSKVSVTTVNGNFEFALSDVQYGDTKRFLNGNAVVNRIPTPTLLVSAPTEDDYASAALAPDGSIYAAYVAFTHGEGFDAPRPIEEHPKDFSPLAKPTRGDQVFCARLANRTWSKPDPVTPSGLDIFGTAAAVDGSGRAWIFWSQNLEGNWDLHARTRKDGVWSDPIRVTSDRGPDIYPAATTDSEGKVWLAWMGFRGGGSDIFAVRLEGDAFGEAVPVCAAPGNQWDPAIAAGPGGEVAVAWDTYQKGDYDVYCRVWKNGSFGEPIPVSTSLRFEARPALTYDKAGRLWIAHEDSPDGWGKDWGWAEKVGTKLYADPNREVTVKVLSDGKLMKPMQDVMDALAPKPKVDEKKRKTLKDIGGGARPPFAAPILKADATGRVWLGARSRRAGSYSGAGTVWLEDMTYYNGDQWTPYFAVPETDNVLENRPSLIALPGGNLVMVNSSDRRNVLASHPPGWAIKEMKKEGKTPPEKPKPKWASPYNNEIFAHDFNLSLGPPPEPKLEPIPAEPIPEPISDTLREIEDVKRVRAYRTQIAGKDVRIFRGEFHRHTEISSDGGGDGMLQDMWRYGLDAAQMDWIGCGDHDNGSREYPWWITQKTTDVFHVGETFVPMFSYERSCNYPDGHRNVVFSKRGVRILPRLKGGMGKDMDEQPETVTPPHTPDSLMLFDYLRFFDGVCASHTSATDMGTDWRDWGEATEPFVEIYQGDRQNYEMPGAPRAITEDKPVGDWRPRGFIINALKKGYRLGFESSSDHVSVHMSYCNVFVEEPTRDGILTAMKRRHVYGSTDNILADVRCGEHFMGDELALGEPPTIRAKLIGTQPFAKVHVIKDGEYVHTIEPKTADVEFTWAEKNAKPGVTSYYYVRGEQEDGEIVWASPMWIKYEPK